MSWMAAPGEARLIRCNVSGRKSRLTLRPPLPPDFRQAVNTQSHVRPALVGTE